MNNISTLKFPITISYPASFKIKFNLRIFSLVFVVLIISLLIYHIFQVNSLTSENALIQNYQKKINEFLTENENLEIRMAKLKSSTSLENLVKEFGFEKVEKIDFIQILDGQIVKE